jgi:hypothetical protein
MSDWTCVYEDLMTIDCSEENRVKWERYKK